MAAGLDSRDAPGTCDQARWVRTWRVAEIPCAPTVMRPSAAEVQAGRGVSQMGPWIVPSLAEKSERPLDGAFGHIGGEGEIRTREGLTSLPVFKSQTALNCAPQSTRVSHSINKLREPFLSAIWPNCACQWDKFGPNRVLRVQKTGSRRFVPIRSQVTPLCCRFPNRAITKSVPIAQKFRLRTPHYPSTLPPCLSGEATS